MYSMVKLEKLKETWKTDIRKRKLKNITVKYNLKTHILHFGVKNLF